MSLKASGPIIKDELFAGISFVHNEKDGFIKDATTGKTLDDRERNFVKLTLKAIINDNLEATLINSYLKNNNAGQRISYVSQTQDSLSSDIDNYDKSKTTNSSLKIKFNTSDNSSIESITTRRYVQDDTSNDWDFTNDVNNPWKFHLNNGETIESLSQEIRYKQTLFDNKLNVLFGLFLDKKEDKFYYTQDTAGGITNIKIDLNDKSLGLFSHFAYKINEKTTFITGLRYDKETKKYKHENQGIDTSNDYSELSPKISLEYKLDENKMIYSTISKGYRAGGFNYLAPKGHEDISFDKESLWSYELGSKLSLYENKIHINSSIYYMDIANMQVTNATSPTEEYVTNVAKAHSIGFEIETNIKVTDTLTSSLSFGYNETKFDEFIDINGDYKGNTNPFAPKYNFNIGTQYRSPLGYYARVDVNGYGKMYFDKENKYEKKAYTLVNTKIGYETNNFDIYMYAKNLFDKNHDSIGYYNGSYTIYSEQREIGVQFAYRF